MKQKSNKTRLSTCLLFGIGLTVLLACKKEGTALYPVTNSGEVKPNATGMITFDGYANGVYSSGMARNDFYGTTVSSWKENRADVVDKTLRVKLMPGDV